MIGSDCCVLCVCQNRSLERSQTHTTVKWFIDSRQSSKLPVWHDHESYTNALNPLKFAAVRVRNETANILMFNQLLICCFLCLLWEFVFLLFRLASTFEWTLSLTSLHPKQQRNSINFHKTSFCGVKAHHCVPADAVVVMYSSAHLSGFVEMLRDSDFYTNYSCTSVDTVTFGKHQQHHSTLDLTQ